MGYWLSRKLSNLLKCFYILKCCFQLGKQLVTKKTPLSKPIISLPAVINKVCLLKLIIKYFSHQNKLNKGFPYWKYILLSLAVVFLTLSSGPEYCINIDYQILFIVKRKRKKRNKTREKFINIRVQDLKFLYKSWKKWTGIGYSHAFLHFYSHAVCDMW